MIICLGAKVDMLPEMSGKLPLRTCRGVVAEFQLPANMGYDHVSSLLYWFSTSVVSYTAVKLIYSLIFPYWLSCFKILFQRRIW